MMDILGKYLLMHIIDLGLFFLIAFTIYRIIKDEQQKGGNGEQ